MEKGRGGMGSHKHGISGHATKSPKLRLFLKMQAESNKRKRRKFLGRRASTVRELLNNR